MSANDTPDEGVITSYAQAPARTITAGGVTYAYRELGRRAASVVLAITWPRHWTTGTRASSTPSRRTTTSSPLTTAASASTGQVPDTVEAMADDAYTFIKALGFSKIDIFSFSLGGFVAQALVVKHPDLVPQVCHPGTSPKGGKDIDKVTGTPTSTCRGRP